MLKDRVYCVGDGGMGNLRWITDKVTIDRDRMVGWRVEKDSR